jgi:hypothetical protein
MTQKPSIDIDPPGDLSSTDEALDLAGFAPKKTQRLARSPDPAVKQIARDHGFSREIREERLDGRSLRRTGRTIQFNVKVTPETRHLLFELCQRHGFSIVEGVEKAIDALARELKATAARNP